MRTCNKCKIEKPLDEFVIDKRNKDGMTNLCKECNKKYYKEYRKNNEESLKKYKREYYKKNAERLRKKSKEYKGNNKDKIKQWREDNKEKIVEKRKEYYKKNIEKRKRYLESNKEKIRERRRRYETSNRDKINKRRRERWTEDSLYSMAANLRTRTHEAFKRKKWAKNTSNETMLGCTYKEAFKHLESKFQEGMTWENHGVYGWHIDHIIPLASATTEEELMKLCHYTNLQPLWASDNWSKGCTEFDKVEF